MIYKKVGYEKGVRMKHEELERKLSKEFLLLLLKIAELRKKTGKGSF